VRPDKIFKIDVSVDQNIHAFTEERRGASAAEDDTHDRNLLGGIDDEAAMARRIERGARKCRAREARRILVDARLILRKINDESRVRDRQNALEPMHLRRRVPIPDRLDQVGQRRGRFEHRVGHRRRVA
jgi:hypothetical protein